MTGRSLRRSTSYCRRRRLRWEGSKTVIMHEGKREEKDWENEKEMQKRSGGVNNGLQRLL